MDNDIIAVGHYTLDVFSEILKIHIISETCWDMRELYKQGFTGIRQWLKIDVRTSPLMINKFTPYVDYKQSLNRLDSQFNKRNNKTLLETLGTSVTAQCPLPPWIQIQFDIYFRFDLNNFIFQITTSFNFMFYKCRKLANIRFFMQGISNSITYDI